MNQSNQQIPKSTQLELTANVLSEPRFNTYLKAAGHDWNRAWQLYLWNAKLGEAFHLPIQTVEVSLRNRLCSVFTERYGPEWGTSTTFEKMLDDKLQRDLNTARIRIEKKKKPLVNGQIVAGLSFGFWVGMLHSRYYPQIWSSDLGKAFKYLPENTEHKLVSKRFSEIARLRNRISHHEPIINRNISGDYAQILRAIDWMCPHSGKLIRPHCRIPVVMRQKP